MFRSQNKRRFSSTSQHLRSPTIRLERASRKSRHARSLVSVLFMSRSWTDSRPGSTKSKMQNGALSSHANGLPAIRRTTRRSESVETAVPDSSSQADMIARSQLTSQSQPQVTGAGAAAAIGRGLRNVANGLFKSATNLGDVSSSASKIPSSSNAPTLRTRQPPSSAPVGRSTRASGMPSLSQLDSLALRSPAGASQSKRRGTDLPSKKPQPSSQLSWLRKKGSPEENSSGDDDSDSN